MACGLSFLAYGLNQVDWSNLVLAVVLAIIIILTCTMNYLHDRSASNVMKSIKSMLPADCMVVRDGKQIKTAASCCRPRLCCLRCPRSSSSATSST